MAWEGGGGPTANKDLFGGFPFYCFYPKTLSKPTTQVVTMVLVSLLVANLATSWHKIASRFENDTSLIKKKITACRKILIDTLCFWVYYTHCFLSILFIIQEKNIINMQKDFLKLLIKVKLIHPPSL